jgi:hypothetical protein
MADAKAQPVNLLAFDTDELKGRLGALRRYL